MAVVQGQVGTPRCCCPGPKAEICGLLGEGPLGSSLFKKGSAAAAAAKSLQSCPTLCDPIDCSPPGSPVHGIFQARVLEWGAIALGT